MNKDRYMDYNDPHEKIVSNQHQDKKILR